MDIFWIFFCIAFHSGFNYRPLSSIIKKHFNPSFIMQYNNFLVILLGVLPSIIWMIFYLKKDIHPEPKKWILLVFFLGVAIAPIVLGIEWQITNSLSLLGLKSPIFSIVIKSAVIIFISRSLIEELSKYIAVRFTIKKNPVFDEPADAMMYMIIAALGFAAVENIAAMYSLSPVLYVNPIQSFLILAIRFVGATFLHTLSSGIVGFYYALSLVRIKSHSKFHQRYLIFKGIVIATILHGGFNILVVFLKSSTLLYLAIPALVIALYIIMKEFKILQKISPKNFKGGKCA